MEDFISLLWVLFIGAAAIFSAAKSNEAKKRQKAARQRSFDAAPSPAMPLKNARTVSHPTAPTPVPSSVGLPSTDGRTSVDTPVTDSIQEGSDEPCPMPAAEDFDLRQAVIYSEILKPRFEE